MYLKKTIILVVMLVLATLSSAQKIALKNNLVMDGMASVNLGVEFRAGARNSIDIPASLNLWSFSDEKKFKNFAVQPEFRRWLCTPFTGHFFGVHAHYALFNVGGIGPFTTVRNNRYEGWLAGVGISYGYNWILAPRWSVEAVIGVGYAYISYDKYPCGKCQPAYKHRNKHYFGPTKFGVNLVFLIK